MFLLMFATLIKH